jgi:hypothetical protein
VPPPLCTTLHVTFSFEVPVTVLVNCTVPPEATVAEEGDTVTTIGGGGGFSMAIARPPK